MKNGVARVDYKLHVEGCKQKQLSMKRRWMRNDLITQTILGANNLKKLEFLKPTCDLIVHALDTYLPLIFISPLKLAMIDIFSISLLKSI